MSRTVTATWLSAGEAIGSTVALHDATAPPRARSHVPQVEPITEDTSPVRDQLVGQPQGGTQPLETALLTLRPVQLHHRPKLRSQEPRRREQVERPRQPSQRPRQKRQGSHSAQMLAYRRVNLQLVE